MRTIHRAGQRGHGQHGWLDTWHSFSFGDYFDPARMGFRVLRVMNDDRIAGGMGFGMHPHRDMEIVTVVLSGALQHRDSLGNGAVLRPGEVQRISAGTGILHSEFNPSPTEPVHLYQIWLLPDRRGHEPGYDQRPFPVEGRVGRWQAVASGDGRDGSLVIHQDAVMLLSRPEAGRPLRYDLAAGRHGWLQVLTGSVRVGGEVLTAGDGVEFTGEPAGEVVADDAAEVLLFDLP